MPTRTPRRLTTVSERTQAGIRPDLPLAHVGAERREAHGAHATNQGVGAPVELVVPDRHGGVAERVHLLDYRAAELEVRDHGPLEAIAAVEEHRALGILRAEPLDVSGEHRRAADRDDSRSRAVEMIAPWKSVVSSTRMVGIAEVGDDAQRLRAGQRVRSLASLAIRSRSATPHGTRRRGAGRARSAGGGPRARTSPRRAAGAPARRDGCVGPADDAPSTPRRSKASNHGCSESGTSRNAPERFFSFQPKARDSHRARSERLAGAWAFSRRASSGSRTPWRTRSSICGRSEAASVIGKQASSSARTPQSERPDASE